MADYQSAVGYHKVTVPKDAAGELLLMWLTENGYTVVAPCGGRGVCGKCRVYLTKGTLFSDKGLTRPAVPETDGSLLSCRVFCSDEGAEILLPLFDESVTVIENNTDLPENVGFALDIGTTTLALAAVDCETGTVIATATAQNPQIAFGADVISRIAACDNGQLPLLQRVLTDAVRRLFCRLGIPGKIAEMTVVGNPTMTHIFAGISPVGIGRYPYTPVFTDTKILSGEELGLPVSRVTLLPSLAAYIGSDAVMGMAYALQKHKKPLLLIDLGTNGEMILSTDKGNFALSTAAGPALEGATLSMGIGGVDGAISEVTYENGTFFYKTVGALPPVGICGSGITDCVACLLACGCLHNDGSLENEIFRIPDTSVSVTAKDIREFQLAKSAIRTGVDILLESAELTAESFLANGGRLCLAGGLGYYINPKNAARLGFFPSPLKNAVISAGNTALFGAVAALRNDENLLSNVRELVGNTTVISPETRPDFGERFLNNLNF